MSEDSQPRCINCGIFIDDCNCVCPYCGETQKCICCIGASVKQLAADNSVNKKRIFK